MPLRTIIAESLVEARIRQALELYPRLAEVWQALLWQLARDPECGMRQPVPGNWYALKTRSWPGGRVPSITVLYQVTAMTVTVKSSKVDELEADD